MIDAGIESVVFSIACESDSFGLECATSLDDVAVPNDVRCGHLIHYILNRLGAENYEVKGVLRAGVRTPEKVRRS